MSVMPDSAQILRNLEIPECECPFKKLPLCVNRTSPLGCHERQLSLLRVRGWHEKDDYWLPPRALLLARGPHTTDAALSVLRTYRNLWRVDPDKGDCDCPYIPGEPCGHVLACEHALTPLQWAFLLWRKWPEEYAEPHFPPRPEIAWNRSGYVALMASRAGQCRLRHPGDLRREDVQEDVGGAAVRAQNGSLSHRLKLSPRRPT